MQLSGNGKILFKVDDSDIKPDGSFDIPKEVVIIGPEAFYRCRRLQTLIIPVGVTFIGHEAFRDCTRLTTLIIFAQLSSIRHWTFRGCVSLKNLIIPTGTISIEYGAFSDCTRLQILTLPEGVAFIGIQAFDACPSIHSIVIAGEDAKKVAHVTTLLPLELQNKVTTQALAKQALGLMHKQLAQVAQAPEINRLFPFLNINSRFSSRIKANNEKGNIIQVSCPKLPDEIFQLMNEFVIHSNPYYMKAVKCMRGVPLPKNQEEMSSYQQKMEQVANEVIKRAKNFQSFFLKKPVEQPEAPSSTHSTRDFCILS